MSDSHQPHLTAYVLGFAISGSRVVLIRKNRPAWQKGRLNGVGGKIEEGEDPLDAMHREFHEETGVTGVGWCAFGTLTGPDWVIYLYAGHLPEGQTPHSMTDEPVIEVGIKHLGPDVRPSADSEDRWPTLPNVTWLVHMGLERIAGGPYYEVRHTV